MMMLMKENIHRRQYNKGIGIVYVNYTLAFNFKI